LQAPVEELAVARAKGVEAELGPLVGVVGDRVHLAVVDEVVQPGIDRRPVGLARHRHPRVVVVQRGVDHAAAQAVGADVEFADEVVVEAVDEAQAVPGRVEAGHARPGEGGQQRKSGQQGQRPAQDGMWRIHVDMAPWSRGAGWGGGRDDAVGRGAGRAQCGSRYTSTPYSFCAGCSVHTAEAAAKPALSAGNSATPMCSRPGTASTRTSRLMLGKALKNRQLLFLQLRVSL